VIFLGLDYGSKTIGVSVSSPSGKVAIGLTTLTRDNEAELRPSLKALKEIVREYNVTCFVLGYPVHMDGNASERCVKTLEFKEKLNRYFKSIPVELWDERLSTQAVSRVFEGTRQQFKTHVDEMAAVYILQGFLDRRCSMANDPTQHEHENDDSTLVLHDEAGNEITLQVLSSRQDGDAMYLLAADEEDEEVMHFKLTDDGDETIFEMVDDEHEDFERMFKLFEEDYKILGITITDVEI